MLTIEISKLRDEIQSESARQLQMHDQLNDIEAAITTTTAEFETIEPQYRALKEQLESQANERERAERERDGLLDKSSRVKQFRSVQERDGYLQTQIDQTQRQRHEKQVCENLLCTLLKVGYAYFS